MRAAHRGSAISPIALLNDIGPGLPTIPRHSRSATTRRPIAGAGNTNVAAPQVADSALGTGACKHRAQATIASRHVLFRILLHLRKRWAFDPPFSQQIVDTPAKLESIVDRIARKQMERAAVAEKASWLSPVVRIAEPQIG